jgi:hypothetical protein
MTQSNISFSGYHESSYMELLVDQLINNPKVYEKLTFQGDSKYYGLLLRSFFTYNTQGNIDTMRYGHMQKYKKKLVESFYKHNLIKYEKQHINSYG